MNQREKEKKKIEIEKEKQIKVKVLLYKMSNVLSLCGRYTIKLMMRR